MATRPIRISQNQTNLHAMKDHLLSEGITTGKTYQRESNKWNFKAHVNHSNKSSQSEAELNAVHRGYRQSIFNFNGLKS